MTLKVTDNQHGWLF